MTDLPGQLLFDFRPADTRGLRNRLWYALRRLAAGWDNGFRETAGPLPR